MSNERTPVRQFGLPLGISYLTHITEVLSCLMRIAA